MASLGVKWIGLLMMEGRDWFEIMEREEGTNQKGREKGWT